MASGRISRCGRCGDKHQLIPNIFSLPCSFCRRTEDTMTRAVLGVWGCTQAACANPPRGEQRIIVCANCALGAVDKKDGGFIPGAEVSRVMTTGGNCKRCGNKPSIVVPCPSAQCVSASSAAVSGLSHDLIWKSRGEMYCPCCDYSVRVNTKTEVVIPCDGVGCSEELSVFLLPGPRGGSGTRRARSPPSSSASISVLPQVKQEVLPEVKQEVVPEIKQEAVSKEDDYEKKKKKEPVPLVPDQKVHQEAASNDEKQEEEEAEAVPALQSEASEAPELIRINMHMLSGRRWCVAAYSDDTIADVKGALPHGIPTNEQRIILNNKILHGPQRLRDAGVTDNSTLCVVRRS